ncbi:PREDICTED: alpha-(1,3)-fucosyltransferase C-like [Polistes dominula]|uniref:Fucosyltransferase n=1 Tax=Polistes dominula TaxID=743375 RepID=A0ABM1IW19_POLDO|nr:PREDICTED: alpha-(1,3)-fucosyltransferase C-like [Polistes dominula]
MSWRCGKISLIILIISISCLYLLAFYFDLSIKNVLNFKVNHRSFPHRFNSNRKFKKILFWNGMFNHKDFYFGDGDIFKSCQVNDCYATYDRSYFDDDTYDAILFHGIELDRQDLPNKRDYKQHYIFVNLESPENRPIKDKYFDTYFNNTMTYRLDSDILWPYGIVSDRKTNKIVAPSNHVFWDIPDNDVNRDALSTTTQLKDVTTIANKNKEIAWLVSNCKAKSGRLEYVEELSKYINVDIYGYCGDDKTCPLSRDCFHDIFEPQYFFYLSFENSLCQDYVTEKLYKALRYNIVPIVYGGANYTRFAPPNSYINALDYDSPEKLAKYLKRLINNPNEYQQYFRWKIRYRIEDATPKTACNLCKFLHTKNKTNTYVQLSNWYSFNKCPLQRLLNNKNYVTKVLYKRKKKSLYKT